MDIIKILILAILATIRPLQCICEESEVIYNEKFVLIITSYNPDTKRMSSFIDNFEKSLRKSNCNYHILIENMGFKGIDECHKWQTATEQVIKKYNSPNLKAIILLGQEAWISFVTLKNFKCHVPFFACFASTNGIELSSTQIDNSWEPQYIDVVERSKNIGLGGGELNKYDVEGNIQLILSFYPTIANIALITDNSYGGVSLQAFVKHEMREKFPNLNLIALDTRHYTIEEIEKKILELPKNTAILIGTWRIDKNGLYFLQSNISTIIQNSISHPVFTLSGFGLDNVAIGGKIPNYQVNASKIAEDIQKIDNQEIATLNYGITQNNYVFNSEKLKQYGINTYQLPKKSIINNNLEVQLRRTQKKNLIFGIFILTLLFLSTCLLIVSKRLKRKSLELETAKNRAEESERLKSTFLANMSHEIRTPLNAIVGFSDILANSDDNKNRTIYGNIISTNSDILLHLINDILDLSKIESHNTEFYFSDVEMTALFNDLYTTFSIKMKPQVELKCITPYQTCTVHTDQQRTTQIITNFITNAIKFTPKGSITFGYEYIDKGLKIYVTDTGIGIDKNNQDKVFGRFEKLNTFAQGTGLGLSICKAITDSLKGNIGVVSEPGKGSTFWAWIPCDLTESRKNSPLEFTKLKSKANIFNTFSKTYPSNTSILVVEDDESNFMLLNAILCNYSIERAHNGKEAVEMVAQKNYSIVLMDIKMPIMNGLEATLKIRKFNQQIPIIAVTANAFDADKEKAIGAGCNDIITKPIKSEDLHRKIMNFIS